MTSDAPESTADPDFPPRVLRQYALLADGERGVLVGPLGDVAWMCAPRWDSDAVFSSLLGGRGLYAITPRPTRSVWGGYYEPGSLIWRERWITGAGVIECREALACPADPHTAVLLRRVEAVDGPSSLRVLLEPRAEFGRRAMGAVRCADGVWTARTGEFRVRWSGAEDAAPVGGGLALDLDLEAGQTRELVLEVSARSFTGPPPTPASLWESTENAWRRAVPDLGGSIAPRDARHAYAILRGLTRQGGGMVAAATMALPERAEARRNYDYRYAWIRDQSYAGQAVAVVEPSPLLDDAVRFASERLLADGVDLKPAYRVDGSPVPAERELTHLPGYPGGGSTLGNHVGAQFQLDVFGEALLLFAAAARHDRLARDEWKAVELAAAAIDTRWQVPDAGIWELDERRWTHSRLIGVAGLRAISRHAPPAEAARWDSLADVIAAEVAADCVHPSRRWRRAPCDDRVDASLLLAVVRGALAPDDPRSEATVAAIKTELSEEGYLYRFRHGRRQLGEAEGAFLLCGFLMALTASRQGRAEEAIAWFERNRAACGPPGLFAEEFDVRQRQLRGNIPQAFVHALLLEAAVRLGQR